MTNKCDNNCKLVDPVIPPYKFEDYSFTITPGSEKDGGGFFLTMTDFPGLLADGETHQEAIEEGRDAFHAVVATYSDLGKTIPKPTTWSSDSFLNDTLSRVLG